MSDLTVRVRSLKDRPLRFFVEDDFRVAGKVKKLLGKMPDYEKFMAERQKIRKESQNVDPETDFLHQEPLLTKAQELHLFRKYNFLKYKFSKIVEKIDVLFPDEKEIEDAENIERRFIDVKHQIVSSNVRFAAKFAKDLRYTHENLIEVMADANLGLVYAVDYFDYRRGLRFCTYAGMVIKDHIFKGRHKMTKYSDQTNAEELLGYQQAHQETQKDILEIQNILQVLKKIPDREREVISSWFGIGEKPANLIVIGERLKVSRERVRQIKDGGLDRILRYMVTKKFAEK